MPSLKQAALALVLTAALCGCSPGSKGGGAADGQTAAQDEDRVPCALDGAQDFAPVCMREIAKGADGEVWIIHRPDGGFRRFVLIDGGTRIATADGAEEVQAQRKGDQLEVRVARDRYLFPAAAAPSPSDSRSPNAPAS